MIPKNRIYQSPLTMVALTAMSEAQKTIIAMSARFKDPYHIAVFIAPLSEMCVNDDYEAALAALSSMYADCGIETTAAFDNYIESDYVDYLLSYYTIFLRDLLYEVFEDEEDLHDLPNDIGYPGKAIPFSDACIDCQMEAICLTKLFPALVVRKGRKYGKSDDVPLEI